jgi:hypothetical protein
VAILLVGISMAGVFGGLRALGKADSYARDAELLSRLAAQKIAELESVGDPRVSDESGDFSEQGYPDITWTMTLEQEADETNLDRVSVTAERVGQSQTITTLIFSRPESTTAATAGATP